MRCARWIARRCAAAPVVFVFLETEFPGPDLEAPICSECADLALDEARSDASVCVAGLTDGRRCIPSREPVLRDETALAAPCVLRHR